MTDVTAALQGSLFQVPNLVELLVEPETEVALEAFDKREWGRWEETWADDEWGDEATFVKRANLIHVGSSKTPDAFFLTSAVPLRDSPASALHGHDSSADVMAWADDESDNEATLPLHDCAVVVMPNDVDVEDSHHSTEKQQQRVNLRTLWAQRDPNRANYWNEAGILVEPKRDRGRTKKSAVALSHQGARMVLELSRQPGRRFAVVVTVLNSTFHLYVANAAGVFCSPGLDARNGNDLRKIVHMVWKMGRLQPHEYGFNPDLCPVPRLTAPHPIHYVVPGYSLADVLRPRCHVTGRAASVFRLVPTAEGGVLDKGPLILKLAFTDTGRPVSELTVLEAIAAAEANDSKSTLGLVDLVEDVALKWERTLSSDDLKLSDRAFLDLRSARDGPPIQRRFVAVLLRPAGRPLTRYRSRWHLWKGLIAVVEAHRRLYKLGYIHRDISVGNIMLSDSEDDTDSSATLIDYDLTASARAQAATTNHRNASFHMAIDHLVEPDETAPPHLLRHDLEAFVWVIFWVVTLYGRPDADGPQRLASDMANPPLDRLTSSLMGMTLDEKGPAVYKWNRSSGDGFDSKWALLSHDRRFNDFVEQVDEFWAPLVEHGIIASLRKLVADLQGKDAAEDEEHQYEQLLEILRRGLGCLEGVAESHGSG